MSKFTARVFWFYLFVYCFPSPFSYISWAWPVIERYSDGMKALAKFIGEKILHLPSVFVGPTGSGDTTADYLLVGIHLLIALGLTCVWSIWRKRNDEKLQLWIYHYVRISLGSALLTYGFAKIIPPGQFGTPTPGRLMESFGDASPMGMLWTFMGASRPYTVFAGVMEVLAGALLFVPRFVSLGAVTAAGVMANVFVLNLCYDVPVKLFSFHLLLFSFVLLAPELPRFLRLFIFNLPLEARVFPTLFNERSKERGYLIVQSLTGLIVAVSMVQGGLKFYPVYEKLFTDTKFFGVWQVRSFNRKEAALEDWSRVAFDINERLFVRTKAGGWYRFELKYDEKENSFELKEVDTERSPIRLNFTQPDNDHLKLSGPMDIELEKIPAIEFPLKSRGFHFISELPFHR